MIWRVAIFDIFRSPTLGENVGRSNSLEIIQMIDLPSGEILPEAGRPREIFPWNFYRRFLSSIRSRERWWNDRVAKWITAREVGSMIDDHGSGRTTASQIYAIRRTNTRARVNEIPYLWKWFHKRGVCCLGSCACVRDRVTVASHRWRSFTIREQVLSTSSHLSKWKEGSIWSRVSVEQQPTLFSQRKQRLAVRFVRVGGRGGGGGEWWVKYRQIFK